MRREKAKKLPWIKGIEAIKEEEEPLKKYTKSAGIAAKKNNWQIQKLRRKRNIDIVEEIKDVASKKSARIAAKKVSDKYKKMRLKKSPPTFLVDEAELETIQYNDESNEDTFANESILAAENKVFDFNKYKKEQPVAIDELKQQQIDNELFVNESVLAAANKVFDFDRYKKEQASALNWYNKLKAENDLEQAETINYVDILNLDDVRENKNARIAAKKISDKHRKIRKRKRPKSPTVTFEGLKRPTEKKKGQQNLHLLLQETNLKKYKNLRYL